MQYWTNVCDYVVRQISDRKTAVVWAENVAGGFSTGGQRAIHCSDIAGEFVRRFVYLDLQVNSKANWNARRDVASATNTKKVKKPIEVFGQDQIVGVVKRCRPLMLRAFPNLLEHSQVDIDRFERQTSEYREQFKKVHNQIRFVGMSVYKEEATAAVPLDRLYIPLRLVAEDSSNEATSARTDPLELLQPGSRNVILGDPGSGKSTLIKFLSLIGSSGSLQKRFGHEADVRLPVLVVLRQYADELKSRPDLSILEYAAERAAKELSLKEIDTEFLVYHLCVGQAILLFDGIDELPNLEFKQTVRSRVADLLAEWPRNTVVLTSRIIGYENEARFQSDHFRHHRVAPLLPDDIRLFVKTWYDERIAGDLERGEHFADLISVLNDEQNEAIQDLATNPLLLTIICLVHRIDGELPDERVVLYHKCTETLLNTWHSWKFRGQDRSRRSSTEKRNRARMEFIAFCMQGLFDSTEKDQRAVVPLDQLEEILEEYLDREESRVSNPAGEAQLFLQFVRERAGLLIEVGDGQFGFVHLTFQEYLAATFLRKEMEATPEDPNAAVGINAVWALIEKQKRHCNIRWHEAIRLLVASLERPDAQRFMIERILPSDPSAEDFYVRSLLAGGILLDQVEGVFELGQAIVTCLLQACISANTDEEFKKPFGLLQRNAKRCDAGTEFLKCAVNEMKISLSACDQGKLALILVGLGWSDEASGEMLNGFSNSERQCFEDIIAYKRSEKRSDNSIALSPRVHHLQNSPDGVVSYAILACLEGLPSPNAVMLLQWNALLGLKTSALLLSQYGNWYEAVARAANALTSFVPFWLVADHARARDLDWALNRAQDRAQDRDRALDRDQVLYLHRDRDLYLDLSLIVGGGQKEFISFEAAERTIRLSIFSGIKASKNPLWWQALKTHRLGSFQLSNSLPIELDNLTLASLPNALDEAGVNDRIATWLICDFSLFIARKHASLQESPFRLLAGETREWNAPLVKIAHCLRDIAYGDESRTDDLLAMVNSDDPVYKTIFREALWID